MKSTKKTDNTSLLTFPLPDLDLIKVTGGSFIMGDDASDYKSEKPAHRVKIPYTFYIGRFLVTQQLYEAVMQINPSRRKGIRRPVEQVSWDDVQKFIVELNQNKTIESFLAKEKIVGKFRLPTESEWEFAARGGVHSQGYAYCGSDDLSQVGWYNKNNAWVDAPDRGPDRVIRGGYYFYPSVYCRPAYRDYYSPDYRGLNIGFRLVFSPS